MNPLVYFSFFPKNTVLRRDKIAAFFDFRIIFDGEFNDFVSAGWETEIAHEYTAWREENPPEKFQNLLDREGIWTIPLGDDRYPSLLKEISDPPSALFIRGSMPDDALPRLGVVGTRKVTSYGRLACEKIVAPLAKEGVVIVSGLALGLDAIAHEQTIQAGGMTLAILGGGVDRDTVGPQANRSLAEKIIETGGALISEYPPKFNPSPYTFPARNRIIAGLTSGTLVIEAPTESGSLITAKCALDYNREVMAVPHPINSVMGEGGNNLLKQGAKVVTCPSDVVDALNLATAFEATASADPDLQGDEATIYALLSHEPMHIDKLIENSGLPSQKVGGILVMMEMRNLARNLGAMRYIKV
jgi:DNA processing protein